jgi:hypothetical protein
MTYEIFRADAELEELFGPPLAEADTAANARLAARTLAEDGVPLPLIIYRTSGDTTRQFEIVRRCERYGQLSFAGTCRGRN